MQSRQRELTVRTQETTTAVTTETLTQKQVGTYHRRQPRGSPSPYVRCFVTAFSLPTPSIVIIWSSLAAMNFKATKESTTCTLSSEANL